MAVPRPSTSLEQAIHLASKLFSFEPSNTSVVTELKSYDDRNFLLKGQTMYNKAEKQATHEATYVLKVLNPVASRRIEDLDLTSKVLLFLNDRGIQCSRPQLSISGKYIIWCRFPKEGRGREKAGKWTFEEEFQVVDSIELASYKGCRYLEPKSGTPAVNDPSGHHHYDDNNTSVYAVRLFTFLPGKQLSDVNYNADVMYKFGLEIGNLHKVLKEFSQTSDFLDTHFRASDNDWNLNNSPTSIMKYCQAVEDDTRRILVQEIAQRFQKEFIPKLKHFDTQVIHGDLNVDNIIVEQYPDGQVKFKGFIDFGEIDISYRVLDVAVAVAYIAIEAVNKDIDSIDACKHVIRGYQSVFPLSLLEVDIVLEGAKTRISHSLVMGAYNYKYVSPDNEYLLYTGKSGWKALDELLQISRKDIVSAWLSS